MKASVITDSNNASGVIISLVSMEYLQTAVPVTAPCITAVVSTLMKLGGGLCVTSGQFFWRREHDYTGVT